MPWKNPGTPGTVTVICGLAPAPGAPGPPAPPRREPRNWARLASATPADGWPTEVVVWPEVVSPEGRGGTGLEEVDKEELVDVWSPGRTGKKTCDSLLIFTKQKCVFSNMANL